MRVAGSLNRDGKPNRTTDLVHYDVYHHDCYWRIVPSEPIQVECPDCGTTIRASFRPGARSGGGCPKCGQPNAFDIKNSMCRHCGLLVIGAIHRPVYAGSEHVVPGSGKDGDYWFHESCKAYSYPAHRIREYINKKLETEHKEKCDLAYFYLYLLILVVGFLWVVKVMLD